VLDSANPESPLMSYVLLYMDGRRRTIYKIEEAQTNTGWTEDVRIGVAHNTGRFCGTPISTSWSVGSNSLKPAFR